MSPTRAGASRRLSTTTSPVSIVGAMLPDITVASGGQRLQVAEPQPRPRAAQRGQTSQRHADRTAGAPAARRAARTPASRTDGIGEEDGRDMRREGG